jgi:hypothetical protein
MVDDVDVEHGLKVSLSCIFLENILCQFVKTAKFGIMARCFECPQYRRFQAEMDTEDERVMDEIDNIREHPERHPDWYPSGA